MAPRIDSRFVSDRVQAFPESVIRSMSRVAAEHEAINLGQGFPDFDPPREIMDAAKQAIDDGYNQYAVTWGAPGLRDAISRKLRTFNRIDADPEKNVVVTCGATEAMMATMLATVDPGNEVVVFEPFYENFGPDTVVAGARPSWVPMHAPDWQPDEEATKEAFSRKPKAVIVNTPGNPTGRIYTKETLRLIADLATETGTLVVTDEIYEHMVYDGKKHISPATIGDLHEQTVTIGGFSKTYSVTGWRLAYTAAPQAVTDAIKRVHDFLTVGAPHPLQIAATAALGLPSDYYTWLRDGYQRKRDILEAALKQSGMRPFHPDSAYYILCDVAELMEAGGFADAMDFAMWLSREVKVTCVPGPSFFADPEKGRTIVRFAYPKREETLEAAAQRLRTVPERLAAKVPA